MGARLIEIGNGYLGTLAHEHEAIVAPLRGNRRGVQMFYRQSSSHTIWLSMTLGQVMKTFRSDSLIKVLSFGAATLLCGCNAIVLDPQGPVGIADKTILIDSLAIMLAIVVPTIAATLAFAWWFRATNARATYLPDFVYSGRIELIVWAVPLLVIMLLGGVAWIGSHDLDPAKPLTSDTPPLEIQAVSLDWKWLFIYPNQHVASVNELVIPVGVPIQFSLTSASVMNAFFIPQLGSMIYTMNGMRTQLNLSANAPGTFLGLSSHYSGDGFSDMHFEVQAVQAERFATWLDATRNTGPTLDDESYAALAKQSMNVSAFTFGSVESGLFQKIVTQQLPPGPGPQAEMHSASAFSPFATAFCAAPDKYARVAKSAQRIER
jgi:cytochrome o ubiquinol oxidase subunit II